MDVRLTSQPIVRVLGVTLLVGSVACGSADEPPGDVRPFLGSFVFEDGVVRATCAGAIAAHDLAGTEIGIEQRGAGEIEVVVGAECQVGLSVRGEGASNRNDAECELSIRSVALDATFRQFRVERVSADTLEVFGSGAAEVIIAEQSLRCDPFELSGTVMRWPVP